MFGNPRVPSGISALRALNSRANATTLNLGLGQPFEDMPPLLRARMGAWLKRHQLAYSPNAGRTDLRQLIGKKYDLDSEGISICHGAQQGLTAALLSILQSGEEILIPDPGFLAYQPMATIVGASSKAYPLKKWGNRFEYDVDLILRACTKKTRAVLVCSPNNPTGSSLDLSQRKYLLRELSKRKIFLVSDDVYAELADSPYAPASRDSKYAVTVNSWSKSLALTGWRIGFVHTNHKDLRPKLIAAHQYLMTCASHPAQVLMLETLRERGLYEKIVNSYREQYKRKLHLFLEGLPMQSRVPMPSGGFYLFVPSPKPSSQQVAEHLLTKRNLLVVPGAFFGVNGEGYLRISVAASDVILKKSLKILADLWN